MAEPLPVLVVDDDETIRNLVVRVLRREQYETAEAGDGAEALERLRERPFAAMVLDLMMPVMTGIEVIRYLETHDDAGAPCVIVVSAAAHRELQQVRSDSVHAVLRKPFELPALIAAVRECSRQCDRDAGRRLR
ncbi:MAG TPA: response regulator [Thermoanaerobaculia bacterium]